MKIKLVLFHLDDYISFSKAIVLTPYESLFNEVNNEEFDKMLMAESKKYCISGVAVYIQSEGIPQSQCSEAMAREKTHVDDTNSFIPSISWKTLIIWEN